MERKRIRIAALLMSLFVALAYVQPANAATARATTMRLEKTTGSVTIKNLNGTELAKSIGMRLFNGNQVLTSSKSEAYISLDSSKAVKLSENGEAALNQKGKQLEIAVKKGKLFFNVSEGLKTDESMNIRTSTLLTGVRGTCGVVEVNSSHSSTLCLLEGNVVYFITDPVSGEKKEVPVRGGEKLTMTKSDNALSPEVVPLEVEDIPMFALEEVSADTSLQKKIADTTDLNVTEMLEYYEEQKKAEEQPAAGADEVSAAASDANNGNGQNNASNESKANGENTNNENNASGMNTDGTNNSDSTSGSGNSSTSSSGSTGTSNSGSSRRRSTNTSTNTNSSTSTDGNIKWSLSSDGTLTASGTGTIKPDDTPHWENYKKNTKKLVVGEGITGIASNSFDGFTSLESASISGNEVSIEGDAFTITQIEENDPGSNLKSVIFSGSVKSIGEYAFNNCEELNEVTFLSDVGDIDLWAFQHCTSLSKLTFSGNVGSIGSAAFEECTSLTSIAISGSALIDDSAFMNCSKLKSVAITSTSLSLGENAFKYCESLEDLTISGNVTSIGKSAFLGCASLKQIKITNSVEDIDIEEGVFENCTSLKEVDISAKIKSIGKESFKSCAAITNIFPVLEHAEVISESAFEGCTGLTAVTISDTVTAIGNSAFRNCSEMTSVTIPSTVTEIGKDAFSGCGQNFTIYGTAGSAAKSYADNNNIPFQIAP